MRDCKDVSVAFADSCVHNRVSSILFGYVDGRPDMYVDIGISYAMLGFVGSVILAKFLGGKKI